MTPLGLEILLWYRIRATDYREGDFSAPAVLDTINYFRDNVGLLIPTPSRTGNCVSYCLTGRANIYLDHILSVPLPECVWIIPIPKDQDNG